MDKLDDQALDEALDLVSARFADLVAQDYQARLLEQLARQLFSAADEEEFAHLLLRAVAQRCGEHNLLYIGLDEFNGRPLLVWQGLAEAPVLSRPVTRSLLNSGHHYLLEGKVVELALHSQFPAAAGLRLNGDGAVLALITLDRAPEERIVRDFLERLGETASQALVSLRLRESLVQTKRALQRQRQQVQKQNRLLALMDDWAQVLSRLEDRFQQLERLLGATVATLGGEKGSLMLLDESQGELVVRATVGLEPDLQERIRRGEHSCRRLKIGEGVAGKVVQSLQPIVVNQVDQEPLFLEPELSQVNSIVCLPLHVDGLALGVMNITHRLRGQQFSAQHLDEGMKLARQASRAINNSRLYHLAVLDPVTEVFSRTHLFQRCGDELLRARRYQRQVSLMALQLTGLEVHRKGVDCAQANLLEVHFTEILRECVRETDLVARLSDSTFAVLMPETDALGAMFAAERAWQTATESSFLQGAGVSVAVGLCSFPDRSENVMRLVSRAEMALALAARSQDGMPIVLAPALGVEMEPPALSWVANAS
jgi:diguanylate cyclase (GGDEF)-like protein